MATTEKVERVSDLSRRMTAAKSIVMADFTGLDVASVTQLRRSLRSSSIDYLVVKNRLAKRAAADAGLEGLIEHLNGPTAMAFALDDPLAPARILQKFIDSGGKLVIKSGMLDGDVLTADQIKHLALLPSREELLSKAVGAIQSPLQGLVGTLSGLLRGLVGTLAALEQSKAEESSATEPAQ